MGNNQKMILGAIAAIVLVGLIGAFVFSQPTGIALNVSNNSTEQGTSSQGSASQGSESQSASQGSGNSVANPSNQGDGTKVCTKCGGTGKIEETTWTHEKCDVCGGSGQVWLPNLKRYGDCPYCEGGYNNVPHTHTKTCDMCGGTGKVQS